MWAGLGSLRRLLGGSFPRLARWPGALGLWPRPSVFAWSHGLRVGCLQVIGFGAHSPPGAGPLISEPKTSNREKVVVKNLLPSTTVSAVKIVVLPEICCASGKRKLA